MEVEMTMTNTEALCRDWLEAKRAEAAANARRIEIEEQLAQALEVPEEGSKTHKLDGYKVTVSQPVSRKLDEAEWQKVSGKCPPDMRPVKIKIEADATGCKWLAKNEPAIWKRIASAFETKPGKIGFKVEVV
jgi:hypothetical protein